MKSEIVPTAPCVPHSFRGNSRRKSLRIDDIVPPLNRTDRLVLHQTQQHDSDALIAPRLRSFLEIRVFQADVPDRPEGLSPPNA